MADHDAITENSAPETLDQAVIDRGKEVGERCPVCQHYRLHAD